MYVNNKGKGTFFAYKVSIHLTEVHTRDAVMQLISSNRDEQALQLPITRTR